MIKNIDIYKYEISDEEEVLGTLLVLYQSVVKIECFTLPGIDIQTGIIPIIILLIISTSQQ